MTRERPDRRGRGIVIAAPIVRIIADRGGGWLVVTPRGHGWLHGSRKDALRDQRWLTENG
jgi:hypothetical protein